MESDNSDAKGIIFNLKKAVFFIIVGVMIFEVFTYFLASGLGFQIYFFTPSGLAESKMYVTNLPIYIFLLFNAILPFPVNVGDLFLTLWLLYLTCLAFASLGPKMNFVDSVKNPSKGLFSNYLFAFTLLANAALFLTLAIQTFQESQGIPTGNPFGSQTDNYLLLLLLTYAPVVEEIGFRIVPIGLTFLTFFYMTRKSTGNEDSGWKSKVILFSFLYPEGVKRELNLKTFHRDGLSAITRTEWAAILVTAMVFGFVHYLSGWGIGKVTSAFAVGVILAVSFIIYGVYAPILIHWFLNFYWQSFSFGAELYPALSPFVDGISYLSLAIGGAFCAYILAQIIEKLVKRVISSNKSHLETVG